jgi:hypothetical protein
MQLSMRAIEEERDHTVKELESLDLRPGIAVCAYAMTYADVC